MNRRKGFLTKIKIGIVGLGTVSKVIHIPVLSTFKEVKIEAVAEVDIKRGQKIARKWKIPEFYRDYVEMYEKSNLDGIFICLPSFLHYEAALDALQHDLHVFCEKPMGLSSADACKLVKMAKKRNLVLAVGYNRRLVQNYRKATNIVKSLKLGKIVQMHGILLGARPYLGWIPSSKWLFNEKDCGVLLDIGCHLLDLITYILSDKIAEISATPMRTTYSKVVDSIAGIFRTKNGALGTINIGWLAFDHDSVQIHGTGGSLLVSPFELTEIYGSTDLLDRFLNHIESAKRIGGMGIRTMESRKTPAETYFKEDRAFLEAISGNGNPSVSGEEAVHVLAVLEAIRESIKSKKWVKVNRHFP